MVVAAFAPSDAHAATYTRSVGYKSKDYAVAPYYSEYDHFSEDRGSAYVAIVSSDPSVVKPLYGSEKCMFKVVGHGTADVTVNYYDCKMSDWQHRSDCAYYTDPENYEECYCSEDSVEEHVLVKSKQFTIKSVRATKRITIYSSDCKKLHKGHSYTRLAFKKSGKTVLPSGGKFVKTKSTKAVKSGKKAKLLKKGKVTVKYRGKYNTYILTLKKVRS